jgi:hypothetical protein
MKTFNLKTSFGTIFLVRVFAICLIILNGLSILQAQRYDPNTGATHYPNGTIYIPNSERTGGPVVTGPDRPEGGWEIVDCDENQASEKRCAELLEEATPDKDGNTPGEGSGGAETTTQSLGNEISSQANEYFSKQLKIKYGVWSKQNGKWMYATNPSEWTSKIIQSWNKKKK